MSYGERETQPKRKEWHGRGVLRPDREHASAVRDGSGVVWASERPARSNEETTRVRLALRDGFFDLREEVLVDGEWTWTCRGTHLEAIEIRGLLEALEDACR